MLSQERQRGHAVLVLASLALLACQHGRPEGRVAWSEQEWALEAACQRDELAACRDLGIRLVEDKRPETDLQRGLILLEVACGRNDWRACGVLGATYASLVPRDQEEGRLERAIELLGRACSHRIATACTHLGETLLRNRGDRARAQATFLSACELGEARGCEYFARMELRLRQRDVGKAERALVRACHLDRIESCHELAGMLVQQPDRQAEAFRLWAAACEKGLGRSCNQLIALGAPLVARKPDCRLIRELAPRRCAAHDRDACAAHAACQLREAPGEGALIAELAAGCGDEHPLSCLYWTDAVREHADADPARVREALDLACRAGGLGSAKACVRGFILELNGAGSSESAAAAVRGLTHHCDGGDAEACCQLGKAYEVGKPVSKDLERAVRLLGKACELGSEGCCPSPSAPAPAATPARAR